MLVIYTSYAWEVPIEEAAEHIGESFTGGYWSGRPPPIPLTLFPTNGVMDMQTGILLAGTGDIQTAEDILGILGGADPR